MPDLVEFRGVTVTFGSNRALDRFDLTVEAGAMVALTGPNGAGKSTALRVAAGQLRPRDGQVAIAGASVDRAKPLIGYVPDKDNHFEEFTARRNLEFFAALYGAPAGRTNECLRLVELGDAADRRVTEFSLGMRRRLLLARALLHQPRVLLLDEALAHLDDRSSELILSILRSACADGAAVVMSTHQRDSAALCDRVVTMDRGRAVKDGPRP